MAVDCCDDCTKARNRLTAAQDAYHDLQLSGSVTLVRLDGKHVGYSSVNAGDLRRYIIELKNDVATACGTVRERGRHFIGLSPR